MTTYTPTGPRKRGIASPQKKYEDNLREMPNESLKTGFSSTSKYAHFKISIYLRSRKLTTMYT